MYHSKTGQVRYACYGVALIVCVWVVSALHHFLARSYTVSIITDSYVSPVARATLHSACRELPKNGRLDPHALCTMLQHSVASVRSVTVDYRNPYSATIKVALARPQALINNGLVISSDHKLISTTEYNAVVLEQLSHMTAYDPEYQQEELPLYLPFLSEVPAEILTEYYIVWLDATCIKLTPRTHERIEFYAWHTTRFSDEMIAAMQYIREKIATEMIISPHKLHRDKRGKGVWKIDLRVPQYLIVSYTTKERL